MQDQGFLKLAGQQGCVCHLSWSLRPTLTSPERWQFGAHIEHFYHWGLAYVARKVIPSWHLQLWQTVWQPDCPHLWIIPAEPASCQKINFSRPPQGVCKIKVTTMTLRRNMHVHITGNPEGGGWAVKLLNDNSHFFNSWPDSREKKTSSNFFLNFPMLPKILWSCNAFVKNRYIASSNQKERPKEKRK